MEKHPESMSTIEKAAAKLATRGKVERAAKPAPTTELPPNVAVTPTLMQGKAQGFRRAPEQYCDIDLAILGEKGYLQPGEGRSLLAQEMRRIKRPLLLNIKKEQARPSANPPANLVMITSAFPGEGKTFVSINLAISVAAELDRRVLLVDADVTKGDITAQLGIEARRGLSDLLHESDYLSEDGVLTSDVERLSILPAGGNTDHIDELYASELMANIVRSLAIADPDRVVLFDAPPLLATTEASVLARNMGQVILVVEANQTPQDAVAQAVELLDGAANVSLLLNKISARDAGSYGYGYGYTETRRRAAGSDSERAKEQSSDRTELEEERDDPEQKGD